MLHILCEITMGKYQEQLLSLEDKLESGLYCELTNKALHDGYIKYTLLYDMIANRISIDEVIAENGGLRLMKNLVWEYDSLPHALICGGTGGGKTYEQYIKLDISIEEAPIKNRFEIRLKNERAYYAVRDLLTYYDVLNGRHFLLSTVMYASWIRKQTRNGATGNYLSAGRGSSGKTESR